MAWIPLSHRLDQLPLILAGPILRRTEPNAVTVWLAVRSPCTIALTVYATADGNGSVLQHGMLAGRGTTIAIGQHLHVVAVTARSIQDRSLEPGHVYVYDLTFEVDSGAGPDARSPVALTLEQALNAPDFPRVWISYFDHQKPTFALPANTLNGLNLVHGSCRKPHGGDYDTLPILDDLIQQTARDADRRPQQLFLTGDQIYGDDVADALLWALTDAGATLLGWEEQLPMQTAHSGATYLTPTHLKPGQRSEVAETIGGFTAGLHNQPERAKSHLFSFGEYCACYLLLWSPVLWADAFPIGQEVCKTRQAVKQWNADVKKLLQFRHTLWKVRRSLANIPTYMIFDDHDISDDWNLNQAWCLRVLGKPLGRHTVCNGLLAYALFQAWGNTPQQFQPGRSGERVLTAAAAWSASAGKDPVSRDAIERYLGLPALDPLTGLPRMQDDEGVLVLDRDPDALDWHYTIRAARHEVVVLDTRTWRGYPAAAKTTAPAMLLSPTAFDRQIREPLQCTDQLNATGQASIAATFVVAPTNLVSLQVIDWIQAWSLRQSKVFHNDVGDAWNLHTAAFSELLAALFERRDRVIVLTGDIHYSAAVRLNYWSYSGSDRSPSHPAPKGCYQLAQLTASAFKNSEFKTQLVHTKLKSLLPERCREWVGWDHPPDREDQSSASGPLTATKMPVPAHDPIVQAVPRLWRPFNWQRRSTASDLQPDWRYRIEWMQRQPAQMPAWGQNVPWLKAAAKQRANRWQPWSHWLTRVWSNHWLQEGREVVGRNNLGVVTLDWQPVNPAIAGTTPPCVVHQDIYWYAPWKSSSVVSSRFSVPLQITSQPMPNA